ncbi:MAG TPA: hypothetical protein VGI21_09025 [Streptosporangiaceae bacterium]|jgi:uncharacterized membrane protein YbhN (UPF0104 family)
MTYRAGSGTRTPDHPDLAALATLAYRLASYWAPLCAGPVAYGLFRIRYRERPPPPEPAASAGR